MCVCGWVAQSAAAHIPQGKALWRDASIPAAVCGRADSITGGGPLHVGQEINRKRNEQVEREAVTLRRRNLTVVTCSASG